MSLLARGVRGWGLILTCMFTVTPGARDMTCRDRYFLLDLPEFKLWSCSSCFSYLFRNEMELRGHPGKPYLFAVNGSQYAPGTSFKPDIEDPETVDEICRSLVSTDCERWKLCCRSALECCHRQIQQAPPDPGGEYCPRTWDGFGCVDDTPAGSRAFIKCPSYIEHSNVRNNAYKDCTSNATWFIDPLTRSEWTNYTTCVSMDVDVVVTTDRRDDRQANKKRKSLHVVSPNEARHIRPIHPGSRYVTSTSKASNALKHIMQQTANRRRRPHDVRRYRGLL